MEGSHERDIRRFRDSLEEKEQEIVELRKTLAKSHGKERQSERAFSGWNLGGVHRDDLDAPYSQGNFVSREDFTRLLKVSETSILSKVQNMFEKEKSSEGLHRNTFLSTGRGQDEEIVRRGESFGLREGYEGLHIERPRREE